MVPSEQAQMTKVSSFVMPRVRMDIADMVVAFFPIATMRAGRRCPQTDINRPAEELVLPGEHCLCARGLRQKVEDGAVKYLILITKTAQGEFRAAPRRTGRKHNNRSVSATAR